MISIKIKDVKNFMSALLLRNTFDFLSVSEVTLTTFNNFQINGHLNKNYYTEEELAALPDLTFTSWTKLKPICYELIKGSKTPEKLKITFCLPAREHDKILAKSGAGISSENISGLYIHFVYEDNTLTAITATSLSIFTMEKTLDHYWDETIKTFLTKHFDIEEL